MSLTDVIEELIEERGLDRNVLNTIISEGMLAAYAKKYPKVVLKAEYDRKKGDVVVFVEKEVVSTVDHEDFQVSLKKARFINKDVEIGEKIWLPFDKTIGRIEILWARQVISARIRKIEIDAIYNSYKDRQGEVVLGVVNKSERSGVVVKVGDDYALLPHSLSIPNERCAIGFTIRALLKEVLPEPRGDYQLILDRSSEAFVKKLFELEIPEVFEGLIEIKKIARIPGYKSKIMVVSNDFNIDPVGTCVGVGGGRIQPIIKELGNEKIDIIAWSDSLETQVKGALKPAQIERVDITDDSVAIVTLDDEQRSLAIGKMGQNIALASRLVGIDIQLANKKTTRNDTVVDLKFED